MVKHYKKGEIVYCLALINMREIPIEGKVLGFKKYFDEFQYKIEFIKTLYSSKPPEKKLIIYHLPQFVYKTAKEVIESHISLYSR